MEKHKPKQTPAGDPGRVIIFDTTLRDGEQSPGFSMGVDAKVKMAAALARLGVDIIEAGFAAASPGDEAAISRIAAEIEGPVICALARATEKDILAAHRALRQALRRRAHVFLSTSPIHRAAKLNMSKDEVLAASSRAVAFARTLFDEVEFSAEDATRTEPSFLLEVLEAAADAGASTLNLPDTVGYATPNDIARMFEGAKRLKARFPGIILSAHCHNDLGLAVANTLAAIDAGARQVEVSINGIGERAGNCALEEIVMALKTRRDRFGVSTDIDTTKLVETSRLLSALTKSAIARNKAIVGANAFAHESGIHQHGMLADQRTYEIMRPEDVGFTGTRLVLGKHSGRHAIADRAKILGHSLNDNELGFVFATFKARADEVGEIGDAELSAMIDAILAKSAVGGANDLR